MRVMIAGGGTGGHVYPGIALAREFQRQASGTEMLFVGTEKGLESRLVPREGFRLGTIRVRGLVGKGWVSGLLTLLRLPIACCDAARLLFSFKPDLVIGSGGYASGPVILMAWMMRRKIVLLETNLVPGLTNRFLAPLAGFIALAWEGSKLYISGRTIRLFGCPIRRELISKGLPSSSPAGNTLLILGGSQGAHAVNSAMVDAVDHFGFFKDDIKIIHQTGPGDYESVREAYANKGVQARVEPFIEDMRTVYQLATLVISRAGATTLAEITACGKPAILIPFPHAAGGHQAQNARALEAVEAALVIRQDDLSGPFLAQLILDLLMDPVRLERMAKASHHLGRPDAAEKIVEACLELVRG